MSLELGHWQCNIPPVDGAIGFIYKITNLIDNRQYIGKKLQVFKTTKKALKNRTNKRRGTKESDWKTYTGSSKSLNSDIEKLGKENFKFEILHWCKNKMELSFHETKFIIDNDAVFSKKFYNEYCCCRFRCHPQNKK
jgi:hypothetical protein